MVLDRWGEFNKTDKLLTINIGKIFIYLIRRHICFAIATLKQFIQFYYTLQTIIEINKHILILSSIIQCQNPNFRVILN